MSPVYWALGVLAALCAGLQVLVRRVKSEPAVGNNPNFLSFQRGYFAAFLPALVADWLQGPYLYRLYSSYGFEEAQIGVLYVCGFASTVLLGPLAPVAADRIGRKKLCIFFTVTYSVACFLKLSRSYGILIIGRVLGGVSTSLLFYAFEAWYVHEHVETHDFPQEWIPVTFGKVSVFNTILATSAGLVATLLSEWMGLGPVAPFMMAIPFLVMSGVVVATQWKENYGASKAKLSTSVVDGLKTIASKETIFVLGAIQALFESIMYIFIFLWTPVLGSSDPPYGLVFSCFMLCIAIGSAVTELLKAKHIPVVSVLIASCSIALLANIICVFSTNPHSRDPNVSFFAFLLMQYAVGLYFPTMSYLRKEIVPENQTISVVNIFRVPLHLISCFILLMLHEGIAGHGNRWIFAICACLAAAGAVSAVRLATLLAAFRRQQRTQGTSESLPF